MRQKRSISFFMNLQFLRLALESLLEEVAGVEVVLEIAEEPVT